jgi:hypothetical protein
MVREFKNEYIKFKIFPAAGVFLQFKQKHGKSLADLSGGDDLDLIADLIIDAHVCACKILKADATVTKDDVLTLMSMNEVNQVVGWIMGGEEGEQKKMIPTPQ